MSSVDETSVVIKATFVDFHRRCTHCDEINALLVQTASIATGQYRAKGKVRNWAVAENSIDDQSVTISHAL